MNGPLHDPCLLQLHPSDDVAVATEVLTAGRVVQLPQGGLTIRERVKIGHKVALREVPSGTTVRKYGHVIGVATATIPAGAWVHSHNLANTDRAGPIEKCTEVPAPPTPLAGRTFRGYRRPSGRVGTRNYLAVVSTVNCSASVAKQVAAHFDLRRLSDFPQIDGVVAFTHNTGCGMPFRGDSHQMLNRVLAGIAQHPNIGAYLLVGLGCEQNALSVLTGDYELLTPGDAAEPTATVPVFTMQESGGTRATIEAACAAIEQLLPQANAVEREEVPASELILATECGGSDAYSGITANPAVGIAADRVVASGGTAILAETTEVYGAEHLLTRRARTPAVADRLLEKIEWWKWYVGLFGAEIDNNPSPGNKEGGLTTIAEKSLGAVAKAGSTALEAVLDYAAPVREKGFVFMDSPGFDPASVTGMVAGGANIAVFTTGRGSCFGCKPTPSIKIATNSPTFYKLQEDMDLNAGTILEGDSVTEVGEAIFEKLLAVASGERTKSEQLGIGDEEFIPWTIGPVL